MTAISLIVFALEIEAKKRFGNYTCLYTGLGKVNATYSLTSYLCEHGKPNLIINLGSAGSSAHVTGSVVHCTRFIQRDMDVTPLGFKPFETPFSDIPRILEPEGPAIDLPKGTCGTGDRFDTALGKDPYDVVDMEAFALALIAHKRRIPFLCLKFISDGADDEAPLEWGQALEMGSKSLLQALQAVR